MNRIKTTIILILMIIIMLTVIMNSYVHINTDDKNCNSYIHGYSYINDCNNEVPELSINTEYVKIKKK